MEHTCGCGTVISPRATRCVRCRCRAAQARYRGTVKGRATRARYEHGVRGIATIARYRSTARWTRARAISNAMRIFVGNDYHGRARTVEQAAAINQRVKERVREFIERLKTGAHLEGRSPSTVFPSAADRAD